MKQEHKPLSWLVKNFNINTQTIEDYDVLEYREDFIKKLKKKCATKEEFTEQLRSELHWQYWGRCEYELIIEVTEDNHILLKPWVGCRNEEVFVDVSNDDTFDWEDFAYKHIGRQIYGDKAKIDVWDQISHKWPEFITYCWEYRHKWQRRNPNEV